MLFLVGMSFVEQNSTTAQVQTTNEVVLIQVQPDCPVIAIPDEVPLWSAACPNCMFVAVCCRYVEPLCPNCASQLAIVPCYGEPFPIPIPPIKI
jgi:hypothetical protein